MIIQANLKSMNERLGCLLASSSNCCNYKYVQCILDSFASTVLESGKWTLPHVYLLDSLLVYNESILGYYLGRSICLDDSLRLKYVTRIFKNLYADGSNMSFAGQPAVNGIPNLFVAIGIASGSNIITSIDQYLAMEEEKSYSRLSSLQQLEIGNRAKSMMDQFMALPGIVFAASTVGSPDSYLEILRNADTKPDALLINDINGFWGKEIANKDLVGKVYCYPVSDLYLKGHIIIIQYIRSRLHQISSSLMCNNLESLVEIWNEIFYGLIIKLSCIFNAPPPLCCRELLLPDHALIELFPLINSFYQTRHSSLNEIKILRHTPKNPFPQTLWEYKATHDDGILLNYNFCNLFVEKNKVSYRELNLVIPSNPDSSISPDIYQRVLCNSLLLWKGDLTFWSHKVFMNCLVITNGIVYSNDSAFWLYDSLETFIDAIGAALQVCHDNTQICNFSIRSRPTEPLQQDIIVANLSKSSEFEISPANLLTPFDDEICNYDFAIVFYPSTTLFEVLQLGIPVLAIFSSSYQKDMFIKEGSESLIFSLFKC